MAKPRLVKVRALFYVLQHITKRGYAYFDTAPKFGKNVDICQFLQRCRKKRRFMVEFGCNVAAQAVGPVKACEC